MIQHSEKFVGEGLTYDDVLLLPAYSEVVPRQIDTKSRFSRNIAVNIPIVSAAMDTVTEARMAIAIAQEGGIGVLHKNMSICKQAEEVLRVKRAENGMIVNPITVKQDVSVGDVRHVMEKYSVGGIPVVDDNDKLIGIVTNRDLRFEYNKEKPITEVMTGEKDLVTAPEHTTLETASEILKTNKIEKLPVVDKTGKLVGLITYRDIINLEERPLACKDKLGRLRVAAGIGITADMDDRIDAVIDAGADAIVIDTAHGHSKNVIDSLRRTKKKYGDKVDVVCGNIATAEAAIMLAEAGADAIKVGIGPGSICTTRIIAGIGVPQLTAVFDVAKALLGKNIPVIADGGIRYSGDVVKALAAGASTIMAGGLLAGVEESPGNTIIFEGRKFKSYRGMGSLDAMQQGSKDRYFQDMEDDISKLVPEGIVGRVPYKGTVSEVIHQLVGGLKAGMGYTGAKDIAHLQNDAKFMKITAAGYQESHPHDITITREAPNYSR
ncbi:MAG: IMP dehydrogenase [Bacteroidales bacterium]|jgi:IMP dehydrogenase|nr:IMP dehydrogenase [Bacteroidales bacterium]